MTFISVEVSYINVMRMSLLLHHQEYYFIAIINRGINVTKINITVTNATTGRTKLKQIYNGITFSQQGFFTFVDKQMTFPDYQI